MAAGAALVNEGLSVCKELRYHVGKGRFNVESRREIWEKENRENQASPVW